MKRVILVLSAISILFLTGCNLNKNEQNNLSGDINNQQQEEIEDNKNIENNKDEETNNDYSWFVTDSYHAREPGAWGGPDPEVFYFSSDNTYTWTISNDVENERVVATKGTWEIKDGKLILHEREQTFREGGNFVESYGNPLISDGELVLVDYTTVTKQVENEIVKNIEYVGISEYWLQVHEGVEQPEIKEYEYKLDGETWFSNVPWAPSDNKIVSIEEYQKIINERNSNYNAMINPKNVFLNAKISKLGNKIVLTADVANPYAFTIDEIRATVNSLENSNDNEIKLGAYTIHKEYIEGFYRWYIEDFSIDPDFVDESFDKNQWYNEEKIPYYITTNGGGAYVKLKNIDGLYYPYESYIPIGDIASVDNIKTNALELVLNPEDKIVLAYGNNFSKASHEKTYLVKELFENESSPIIGSSYYNEDSFEIKDGVLYIYIDEGGGN